MIHTHSTHLVALTLRRRQGQRTDDLIPPITPYFVMKVGHVPLIAYARPGAPAVAETVAQRIADYAGRGIALRAVMLDRLGPNVWHGTPAQTMAVLEELEETARLWLLSNCEASALSPSELEELHTVFNAPW